MRSTRTHALRLAITVGVLVALGLGALPAARGAPRVPQDTLVVAQGFDPRCLSPLFGTAQQDKNVSGQVVERLVQFSPDSLGYTPELAIRWEKTAPDTLRVHLRRGVRFTNGEEFNAHSARYSLEQMLRAPSLALFIAHLSRVEVVDLYTVDIKAKGPTSERLMLSALAMGSFQYPPQYTERVGLLRGFCTAPVGTGPYKFVEWVKDDRVVFEANTDYWGGTPRIRRLIFRPIPEGAARVAALQAGDIDLGIEIPLDAMDRVSNDPNLTTHAIRGMRIFRLTTAAKWEGPLQNKKSARRCSTPWTPRPSSGPCSRGARASSTPSRSPPSTSATFRGRSPTPTTPSGRSGCWRRPASRTGSRSRSSTRTAGTRRTRRSARSSRPSSCGSACAPARSSSNRASS